MSQKLAALPGPTTDSNSHPRSIALASLVDPSLSPLANLQARVAAALPTLDACCKALVELPVVSSMEALAAVAADVRSVGGCLRDEDCLTLFRSSGLLAHLCTITNSCTTILLEVVSSSTEVPSAAALASFQATLLTLAASSVSRTNRAVMMSSGACRSIFQLAASIAVPSKGVRGVVDLERYSHLAGLESQFMPAALAFVEVWML